MEVNVARVALLVRSIPQKLKWKCYTVWCREFCGWQATGVSDTKTQKPGLPVAQATKFYTVAYQICGSLLWDLLRVTVLEYRISGWLLDFRKISVPLVLTLRVEPGGPVTGVYDTKLRVKFCSHLYRYTAPQFHVMH